MIIFWAFLAGLLTGSLIFWTGFLYGEYCSEIREEAIRNEVIDKIEQRYMVLDPEQMNPTDQEEKHDVWM